jgi:hypothetical protein
VFLDNLDIRESYTIGSLAKVFQTEVYAILACSDYCRSVNMHKMTICMCSDSKAALLGLSSYTISFKLLHQCWLSLQDLSNNNRVRMFWVSGDIKVRPEPCVPLSASIVRDMNRKWVIDAHSKHWIVLNSCRQSKLWIKHPKLQTTKYLMSLP